MPDIQGIPYNYNNELADTGVINTAPPASNNGEEGADVHPIANIFDILGGAGAIAKQENPWIKSTKYNIATNTKLSDTLRYADPTYGFNPYNPNLENQYGDRQSWLTDWGHTIVKTGANAIGAFAQTIATIPNAINAIASGDISKMEDNPINNGVSDMLEGLDVSMPTFTSTWQQAHPVLNYIPFVGNGWGKVLQNVGFVGGAIGGSVLQDALIGAITGGVGEAPLIGMQLANLSTKIGKMVAGGAKAFEGFNEALTAGKEAEAALNTANTLVKVGSQTRYALAVQTAAWSQAAMMANGTHRLLKDELQQDFYDKHGYDAVGQDLDKVNEYAKHGANADLLATATLLSITDAIQFPTILKPFAAAKRTLEATLDNGVNIGLNKGSLDAYEEIVNPVKGFKGILNKGIPSARLLASTGAQSAAMGGQMFFQRTAEDFYKRKFNDDTISNADNLTKSMSSGIQKVFYTQEGLEGVIMGGLIGLAIHGFRHAAERLRGLPTNKDAMTATTLSLLNSNKLTGTLENHYDEVATSLDIQRDMQTALKNNDLFEFKNLQHQAFFDLVHSGVKANRFESRIEQLKLLKELTPEQFKQMFGMEFNEGTKATANEYVDAMIEKAYKIKNIVDKVNRVFTNPHDAKAKPEDYYGFEEFKKQLAIDLSEVQDNRSRIGRLHEEIGTIASGLDTNKLVNLTSEEGIHQTIKDFKARIKELEKDEKLSIGTAGARKEKEFLQDKINTFESSLKDFDPAAYMKAVHKTIDYFSGGYEATKSKSLVSPIDLPAIFQKAGDIYKLGVNSEKANASYENLLTKPGFADFIAKIASARAASGNNLTLDKDGVPVDKRTAEGIIDDTEYDADGNPIEKVAPIVPTPEVAAINQAAIKEDEILNKISKAKTKKDLTKDPEVKKYVEENLKDDKGNPLNVEKNSPKFVKETAEKKQKANQETKTIAQKEQAAKASGVELSGAPSQRGQQGEDNPNKPENVQKSIKASSGNTIKKIISSVRKVLYDIFNPQNFVNRVNSTSYQDKPAYENLGQVLFGDYTNGESPVKIDNNTTLKISKNEHQRPDHRAKPIAGADIYRKDSDTNIEISVGDKHVGKLQDPNSLVYTNRAGEETPLHSITQDEYEKVTGNTPSTYTNFIKEINSYKTIFDKIKEDYKNGEGKTELSAKEVQDLFDILPYYGNAKPHALNDAGSTLLSKLKVRSKGDIILSLPMIYGKDENGNPAFRRTDKPIILGEATHSPEDLIKLQDFLDSEKNNNLETIRNLNSRYVYINQMPDGTYRSVGIFAARPAKGTPEVIDNLFKTLTTLPQKVDINEVRAINNQLANDIYIADSNGDKGSGTNIRFTVNQNGEVILTLQNSVKGYKVLVAGQMVEKGITRNILFSQRELKGLTGIPDLVKLANEKIAIKEEAGDGDLAKLQIRLSKEDFKNNIPNDDEDSMNVKAVEDRLTVPTAPLPYEKYSLKILPKGSQEAGERPIPEEPQAKVFSRPKLVMKLAPRFKEIFGKPATDVQLRRILATEPKFTPDGKLDPQWLMDVLNVGENKDVKLTGAVALSDKLGNVQTHEETTSKPRPANLTAKEHEIIDTIESSDTIPDTIKAMAEIDPRGTIQMLQEQAAGQTSGGAKATTQGSTANVLEQPKIEPKEGDIVTTPDKTQWTYRVSSTVTKKGETQAPSWQFQDAKGHWQNAGKSDLAKIDEALAPKAIEEPTIVNEEPKALTLADQLGADLLSKIEESTKEVAKIEEPLKITKLKPAKKGEEETPEGALKYSMDTLDPGFAPVYLFVDEDVKQDATTAITQDFPKELHAEDYLRVFAYENRQRDPVVIDLRGLTHEEIKAKLKYFHEENKIKELKPDNSAKVLEEVNDADRWMKPIPTTSYTFYGHVSDIQKAFISHAYDKLISEGKMTEQQLRDIVASTKRREEDLLGRTTMSESGLSPDLVDQVMFRVNHPELIENVDYWKTIPKETDSTYKDYIKTISEVTKNGDMMKAIESGILSPEDARKILDATTKNPRILGVLIEKKLKELKEQRGELKQTEKLAAKEEPIAPPIEIKSEGVDIILPKEVTKEIVTNIPEKVVEEPEEEFPKAEEINPFDSTQISVQKLLSQYEDGDVNIRNAADQAKKLFEIDEQAIKDNLPQEYKELSDIIKKADNLKPREKTPVAEATKKEPFTNIKEGDVVVVNGQQVTVDAVEKVGDNIYYQIGDHFVKPEDVTLPNKDSDLLEAYNKATESPKLFRDEEGVKYYNQMVEPETPEEADQKFTYVGLKTVLERLSNKFGINYKVVDVDAPWKGRFKDGQVLINLRNVGKDTPFHEFLHPFIESVRIDNPELYNQLHKLLAEDPDGQTELKVAKIFYKNDTEQEQKDEALITYLSKKMSEDYEAKSGKRIESKFFKTIKDLIQKFRTWIQKVVWGFNTEKEGSVPVLRSMNPADFSKVGTYRPAVGKGEKIKIENTNFIEQMTLGDFASFVGTSDVKFDLSNTMDAVKAMDRFQKKTFDLDTDEGKLLDRIQRKLRVLEATGKERIPSGELLAQAKDVSKILSQAEGNEALSVANYIHQGINAISYANSEFSAIQQLIHSDKPLTSQQNTDLFRRLQVSETLMSFYDDVENNLWRVVKGMDKDEFANMQEIIGKNNINKKYIHGMTAGLLSDWLYPYIEDAQKNLTGKNERFKLTKDQFKNKLLSADADLGTINYWLSSIGSMRDPVNAIVKTAMIDIFKKNHEDSNRINLETQDEYQKFLQRTGLKNERKATSDWNEQNYLRKALNWEKTGEDKEGKPIYGYVERKAFHEEFFHDLQNKKIDEEIEKLGEKPDPGEAAYKIWDDKRLAIVDKYTQQRKTGKQHEIVETVKDDKGHYTQVPTGKFIDEIEYVPSEEFRNPTFEKLKADPFYQKIYNLYKEANSRVSDNRLPHGIIPQVSKGKNVWSDLKWSKGLGNVKILGKALANNLRGQDDTFNVKTEDGEVNFGNHDVNLDGSTYKRIKHAYTRLLDDSDVDTVLVESVLKFHHSATIYDNLKEAEPNIKALQDFVTGSGIDKEGRRVKLNTTSKVGVILDKYLGLPQLKERQLSRLNTQLNKFIDDVAFDDGEFKDNLQLGNYTLSLNKLGSNLGLLTALNNMAFNVGGGIANVLIGDFQSLLEGFGGKYYTKKDWLSASKEYWSNVHNIVGDVTNVKKSPITQLIMMYDAIQGEFRDKYGKNIVGSVAQRYTNLDSVFFINHIGEHEIQTKFMLAMMRGQKVPTKSGAELNLRDAYQPDKNGNMRLVDDAIWTDADKDAFTSRLHSKNYELNGNYSSFDKAMIQRKWYGKMALVYRKYLYNAFRARYSDSRMDYELRDVIRGNYNTFFSKLASDIQDYKFEAAKRFFTREGWNAEEKYAYNKTVFELSSAIGVAMLAMAIAHGANKQSSPLPMKQLYLRLLNLENDLNQYTIMGVPDMIRIAKNPSVVLGTLGKYADFFGQLGSPTEVYQKKQGIFPKGSSKLMAKFVKAFPGVRQVVNFLGPDGQIQFYQMGAGTK